MKSSCLILLISAALLLGCDSDEPEKQPKLMHITKIVVTRFPATTTNGAGWDFTSGPDIYPRLLKGSTTIYDSPDYFPDATASERTFTPAQSIEINSPTSEYSIELYDYDSPDPDDYMGGIIFRPYAKGDPLSEELILDAGGLVAFRLTVVYSF